MPACSVISCGHQQDRRKYLCSKFRVPKSPIRRSQWLSALCRDIKKEVKKNNKSEEQIVKSYRVCECHFESDLIVREEGKLKATLKRKAVPTLHLGHDKKVTPVVSRESPNSKRLRRLSHLSNLSPQKRSPLKRPFKLSPIQPFQIEVIEDEIDGEAGSAGDAVITAGPADAGVGAEGAAAEHMTGDEQKHETQQRCQLCHQDVPIHKSPRYGLVFIISVLCGTQTNPNHMLRRRNAEGIVNNIVCPICEQLLPPFPLKDGYLARNPSPPAHAYMYVVHRPMLLVLSKFLS